MSGIRHTRKGLFFWASLLAITIIIQGSGGCGGCGDNAEPPGDSLPVQIADSLPILSDSAVSVGADASIDADKQSGAILIWSAQNVVSSPDTLFFFAPGFSSVTTPKVDAFRIVAPYPGVLRNLFVRHNAGPASDGVGITYSVFVNGQGTLLTCEAQTGSVGGCQDTLDFVQIAQGDGISVAAGKPINVGANANAVDATVTLDLVGDSP